MEPKVEYYSYVFVLTQHWGSETNVVGLFASYTAAQKVLPLIPEHEWSGGAWSSKPSDAKLGSLTYRIEEYRVKGREIAPDLEFTIPGADIQGQTQEKPVTYRLGDL